MMRCNCGGLRHKCDMEEIERLKHDLGRAVANHSADLPPSDADGERYRWLRGHIAPSILSRLMGERKSLLSDQRPEALDKWLDTRLKEVKP